jgi:hypothetical protein
MILIKMETKKMESLKKNAIRKDRDLRLDLLNNESIHTANTYRLVLGADYVDSNSTICIQNRKRVN